LVAKVTDIAGSEAGQISHSPQLYVVVCRSVCLSVVCNVRAPYTTQAIEIFRNVSTPFGTLAICDPSTKFLRRSSQGNPSVGGKTKKGVKM